MCIRDRNYTIGDTMGFPAARGDANMGSKGDCVIPQTLESNVRDLHSFLFDDPNYEPSDMVKKISAKISADSDMYKEAKPIESVGTDGGYIPPATTAASDDEEDVESTGESESSEGETDESLLDFEYEWGLELETDEDGNIIDPPEDFDYGLWRPGDLWDDMPTESGGPGADRGPSDESGSRRPSQSVRPSQSGSSSESESGSYGPGGSQGPSGTLRPSSPGGSQNSGNSENSQNSDGPGG